MLQHVPAAEECCSMCLALNQTCADQLSLIPQGSEGIVRRLIGNTNVSLHSVTVGSSTQLPGTDVCVCPHSRVLCERLWIGRYVLDWVIGWMIDWMLDWMIDWMIDRLIDRLIDWLDDWLDD